jgi:hypothetical protein
VVEIEGTNFGANATFFTVELFHASVGFVILSSIRILLWLHPAEVRKLFCYVSHFVEIVCPALHAQK